MGICVSCRRRERKAPEKRWVPGAGGPAKGAAAELLPRRVHLPAMANSISNIKMTNPIKGIVSKRRKRYVKDGFNLDLAYITDRLIAMGFPAEKLEGVYRNHIDEVYRFLEQMHKDHYKIYNLCAERSYDSNKFHKRVERFAFEDHAPPKIEQIRPFCENVHEWLNKDSRNVAAVHCKAGKGRTGTMVCCYLLYSGQKATADEALKFYGIKRAHDEKGVTIPSQRRYVEYFAALVRGGLSYRATRVHVRELLMSPPPALTGLQATLELSVSQLEPQFKAPLGAHELRRHDSAARVSLAACTPLQGDVRVDVYYKPKMMMRKERLFHFWFNTFFVTACVGATPVPAPHDSPNLETFKLTLDKWQLDDAHKDKQHKLYSPDFKVELIIQKQPESSTFSTQSIRAPSTPSTASSCSDADEHWDSGEAPRTRNPPAHNPPAPHTPHTPPPYCDDRTRNPPAHTPPTPNTPPPYCDHRTLCMDTSFELKSFPDEPVGSNNHKSNDVPGGDLLCADSLCTNIIYPLSMDRRGPVVMCDGNDSGRDQRFDDIDGMYDNVQCPVNNELYSKNIKTNNDANRGDSQTPNYSNLYLENLDRTEYDVSQAPQTEYSVNRNPNPSHRCIDTVNNGNKHVDDSLYTHRPYPIKTERYTVSPEYTIESDLYVNKRNYPVNAVFANKMEYSLNTDIYLEKQSLNTVYPTKPEYPINKNLYTDDSEYMANKEKLSEYRVDTGSSKNDLDRKNRKFKDALCKPRLSLGDMRASWREFSGKFGENRKKKHRDDCQ